MYVLIILYIDFYVGCQRPNITLLLNLSLKWAKTYVKLKDWEKIIVAYIDEKIIENHLW